MEESRGSYLMEPKNETGGSKGKEEGGGES